jgi:DNA-binding NarL/FixJ family response regulator
MSTIRNENLSQFRVDVHMRWRRGLDTRAIALDLHVDEHQVERELHRIMDARFAANAPCGNE